jgi:hypothetical protein
MEMSASKLKRKYLTDYFLELIEMPPNIAPFRSFEGIARIWRTVNSWLHLWNAAEYSTDTAVSPTSALRSEQRKVMHI